MPEFSSFIFKIWSFDLDLLNSLQYLHFAEPVYQPSSVLSVHTHHPSVSPVQLELLRSGHARWYFWLQSLRCWCAAFSILWQFWHLWTRYSVEFNITYITSITANLAIRFALESAQYRFLAILLFLDHLTFLHKVSDVFILHQVVTAAFFKQH